MAKLILCLSFIGLIASVYAYPNGVPATASVCKQMNPGHGAKAQKSPAPCSITSSANTVRGGDAIQVTINSTDAENALKGFYIQARNSQNSAIGSFVPSKDANVHSCGGIRANAAHHVNKEPKKSVTLTWKAPAEFTGSVIFTATCLKDFNTFWTLVQSPAVNVQDRNIENHKLGPSSSPSYSKVSVSHNKSVVYSTSKSVHDSSIVEKQARIMNKPTRQKPTEKERKRRPELVKPKTVQSTTPMTQRIYLNESGSDLQEQFLHPYATTTPINNLNYNNNRLAHPSPSSPFSFGSTADGKKYLAAALAAHNFANKPPPPYFNAKYPVTNPTLVRLQQFMPQGNHFPQQPLVPDYVWKYNELRNGPGKFVSPKPEHGFQPNFSPFPPLQAPPTESYKDSTVRPHFGRDFYRASPTHHHNDIVTQPAHRLHFPTNPPTTHQFARSGHNSVLLPSFGYLVFNPQRGPPFYIVPTQDLPAGAHIGQQGDNRAIQPRNNGRIYN